MAFETKVVLQSVLNQIVLTKDHEQLYKLVSDMAKVEGMQVPSYKEKMAELGLEIQEEDK